MGNKNKDKITKGKAALMTAAVGFSSVFGVSPVDLKVYEVNSEVVNVENGEVLSKNVATASNDISDLNNVLYVQYNDNQCYIVFEDGSIQHVSDERVLRIANDMAELILQSRNMEVSTDMIENVKNALEIIINYIGESMIHANTEKYLINSVKGKTNGLIVKTYFEALKDIGSFKKFLNILKKMR